MIGDVNQSIAAIASAAGAGLRGLIRCSGPELLRQLDKCVSAGDGHSLAGRKRACVVPVFVDAGEPLGPVAAKVFLWPTRHSYTRQPSAEIHCTAALPVLHEIIRCLGKCGIRNAAPGEFTLRAFLAGRIDLTQAEAVLGVIDARSEAEMQLALKQLAGGLANPIELLRNRLLDLLAQVEAGLDFVEDDIEFVSRSDITNSLQVALNELDQIVKKLRSRRMEKSAVRVAICGRPNTGKSSLFNALARRAGKEPLAIVSSEAGTTRDYSSFSLEVGGVAVELFDTAGIMSDTSIDRSGEPNTNRTSDVDQRAGKLATIVRGDAHIVLFCIDTTCGINDWERQQVAESSDTKNFLVVKTKSDLPRTVFMQHIENAVAVSSVTGTGLSELLTRIQFLVSSQTDETTHAVIGTSDRCTESVEQARDELELALQFARNGEGDEVIAGSLRMVLDELAIISGRVYTDDILDRVFSRFCIGK